ncbi:MAG: chorismate lyase [Acidiferrobacterales bacterium]
MTAKPGGAHGSPYHPEPMWVPRKRFVRSQVPPAIFHWLVDRASLTQRIIGACDGQFRVQVLSQHWIRPMSNEVQALGMRMSGRALVRQVQLLCNDIPWVYARTVIPPRTLTGHQRRLAHLESRSLGAMLFADPSMRRGELQLARLTGRDKLHAIVVRQLGQSPAVMWGRRSIFTLARKPLLVSEIFLPAIQGHKI